VVVLVRQPCQPANIGGNLRMIQCKCSFRRTVWVSTEAEGSKGIFFISYQNNRENASKSFFTYKQLRSWHALL
jgi:hypothetical protein